MPRLTGTDVETLQAGSGYKFSGTRIEKLGAYKYTLVGITCDTSGSVQPFAAELERMLKTILASCQKSPMRDNLMIRLTQFGTQLEELHGFKLLSALKDSDYNSILRIEGMTALYEATDEMVQCMAAYAGSLTGQDFLVNGIIFVITDGQDNQGQYRGISPSIIAKSVEKARLSETMESLRIVLIGVTNNSADMGSYLQTFKDEAKIDQYVDIGSATPGKCAKLADFVSQSVSSQSQSLGTGGPSQPIQAKF